MLYFYINNFVIKSIKIGLFIDFFIKRFILKILKSLITYHIIYFNDKFLIEIILYKYVNWFNFFLFNLNRIDSLRLIWALKFYLFIVLSLLILCINYHVT